MQDKRVKDYHIQQNNMRQKDNNEIEKENGARNNVK